MSLLHYIVHSQIAERKKTDDSDIRIRIPLHIIASLPLAKKKTMTATKTTRVGQANYGPEEVMHLLEILQRIKPPLLDMASLSINCMSVVDWFE